MFRRMGTQSKRSISSYSRTNLSILQSIRESGRKMSTARLEMERLNAGRLEHPAKRIRDKQQIRNSTRSKRAENLAVPTPNDITRFCTAPGKFCVLSFDTTLNSGPFYMTVAVYRHLMLRSKSANIGVHPVKIGAAYLHHDRTEETY